MNGDLLRVENFKNSLNDFTVFSVVIGNDSEFRDVLNELAAVLSAADIETHVVYSGSEPINKGENLIVHSDAEFTQVVTQISDSLRERFGVFAAFSFKNINEHNAVKVPIKRIALIYDYKTAIANSKKYDNLCKLAKLLQKGRAAGITSVVYSDKDIDDKTQFGACLKANAKII